MNLYVRCAAVCLVSLVMLALDVFKPEAATSTAPMASRAPDTVASGPLASLFERHAISVLR